MDNKFSWTIKFPAALLAGVMLMGASFTAKAELSQSQGNQPTVSQPMQLAWYVGPYRYWGPRYPAYFQRPWRYHNVYRPACRPRCVTNWRGEVVRCFRRCY